ncbi:gliding motility-associated C-terminal domain-containing protein [Saprospira grandis]|uniref:T9SS type B sorting domain-containing protein n=1 Tax=Saprospira grandis TaxID=1008 RepID=UPI0022DD347F|nr:gliding motility-associated C-terminal domain-containing protein [Saprospira grandis]WBM74211.1 gliding motility-associated C-terminal domain-containing protein [Saprospira grandis]
MKQLFLSSLFLLANLSMLWATHNRAGEITYRQTGPLSIEATIVTYTKISGQSIHADRTELDLSWGDGTSSTVPRDYFVMLHQDIRMNVYTATHSYPGPNPGGQPYVMGMQDPNRNADILNVNNGNSVNVAFYVQTEVFLFPTSIYGNNNSPILLEPPIDFGVVGQVFQHTPNGYDPDGDSVAYELVTCLSDLNNPVPGFLPVNAIGPGANNTYTFDQQTGLFTWNTPQVAGEYNIAIRVKSYRNGAYLGGIIRDIQIEIRNAQNTPPELQVPEEICVEAGELIDFDAIALDSDIPVQPITLTATGGPLELTNGAATFSNTTGFTPVSSRFRWQTNCEHIQQQAWQVVFKARDSLMTNNGLDASLATFKVLRIKVVAPPVQNLQSTVSPGQVDLSWDAPYLCESSAGFLGFSVWRKSSCDNTELDSCTVGLPGLGYTQINFGALVTTAATSGNFEFTDPNVQSGGIYSYRVLPEFATPVPGTNNFLGPVSGRSSAELCVQMAQDLPLMTNADVESTDLANGDILVRWAKPRAAELDTNFTVPPYRYELFRSEGQNGANFLSTPIFSSTNFNSYSALADTLSFLDTGLNTEENAYSYRVAFYANGDTVGATSLASSIYLTVNATDQTNELVWTENVPWTNTEYVVFLETPTGSNSYTVLDTVNSPTYVHEELENGETYCYYVESIGSYGIPDVFSPLLNKSQRACGSPLDTLAPCPPIAVAALSGCEAFDDDSDKENRGLCEGFIREQTDMANTISWQRPTDSCGLDIAAYRLYFAPYCDSTAYELVAEITDLSDTFFIHQPADYNLAGCYYVTTVDSVEANGGGNESVPSTVVQSDNCPFYELPNVFTPNNDNANDFFGPCLPSRYIEAVDFRVFNRWGQEVFRTENPAINWDGKDQQTGQDLAEDVYYYTCKLQINCMDCDKVAPLKGVIHLIRNAR